MNSLTRLLLVGSVIFSLASVVSAAERTNPNSPAGAAGEERDTPGANEPEKKEKRWFTGGSLGVGRSEYNGELATTVANHEFMNDSKQGPAVQFEGFFAWRLPNHKTLVGPSLSISVDEYESDFMSDLTLRTYFLSAMIQHHFTGDFHRGFFARLDVGFTEIGVSDEYFISTDDDESYAGSGVRIGAGYVIPLGEKLGLPIFAQYQHHWLRKNVENRSTYLSVGIIF